jgi:hypothetical protein
MMPALEFAQTLLRGWHGFRSIFHRAVLAAFATGLVASCGGGVDSGGTGAPASAFASGPITGFGSVIVNGVHFDDRAATVSDTEGNTRSRDELRLGMTTDVRGSAIGVDSDGNQASQATSIVFGSEILGPLAASDLVARTLTVLGQTVDIATSTAFDSGLPGGQTALAVGNVVEIYGHFDAATGHYAATRVERKTAAVLAYRLRGVVSALDSGMQSFAIGATRIAYAGLTAANLPATLANGEIVRVFLALVPSGPVWNAIRVADGVATIENREEVTVKGLVSAFTSATQFSVDGTPVDARNAQFPTGSAGLGLGTRVEVEGATVGGVLIASRVTVVTDGDDASQSFETRGAITALDTVAKTFVVHDVTVSYSGTIDYRNGSAVDLAVGRSVEARGTLSTDGTRLQASRITFRD